ncbi:unnamed protein product [Rotaria sordida]|uniref:SKI-interacting protein SKIP SNW domain-containing protein n=1 Tax=Rotaria sordida TaxID=392033 RepID=A0A813X2Z3_9BILA|nr:unnamed protein product [Rotaria sordida]
MATKFSIHILSIYYPKELRENDPSLQKPSEDKLKEKIEKTRQVLEALVSFKVSAAISIQHAEKQALVLFNTFVIDHHNKNLLLISDSKQCIIQIFEVQKDLMEPPRFNPPVPILHSPTRKVTIKEQQNWKISLCISNWKNTKAREAVDMRAKVEKQVAKKQKEEKEEQLRELALHARTGICLADKSDDQSAERDQIR